MNIDYYKEIRVALWGEGPFCDDTTPERADWSGMMGVLTLYDLAVDGARAEFVAAMRRIIEDPQEDQRLVADTIRVAVSLNLTDLDSIIRNKEKTATDPYVVRAAKQYIGIRNVALHHYTLALCP